MDREKLNKLYCLLEEYYFTYREEMRKAVRIADIGEMVDELQEQIENKLKIYEDDDIPLF